MEKVYLSLGSNLGDRNSNLLAAVNELDRMMGAPHSALSSFIETRSWGFSGHDFINCAVMYETELPPEKILGICKSIERSMGRRETVEYDSGGARIYHDRVIDIDILLYGRRTVDTPELKIPHPLMREREFVMRPLMEIYR
ncbi:MAG TPA: 2-amino-4-hydroxy-6-hydroxymethyldihydropteridine diphosphokinase [Candidatus Cryptobacteroides excrementigallinarum]|nr:2-amino-4-hydroxy-6-hydroxymethyldihydropteridine diphosphokinase [Candidatus Cryptobacteroides excrementigallinarum]